MEGSALLALLVSLERISKAISVSSEELEVHIGDPVVADYFDNLQTVKNDLDTTIYAIEQSLTEFSSEGHH